MKTSVWPHEASRVSEKPVDKERGQSFAWDVWSRAAAAVVIWLLLLAVSLVGLAMIAKPQPARFDDRGTFAVVAPRRP